MRGLLLLAAIVLNGFTTELEASDALVPGLSPQEERELITVLIEYYSPVAQLERSDLAENAETGANDILPPVVSALSPGLIHQLIKLCRNGTLAERRQKVLGTAYANNYPSNQLNYARRLGDDLYNAAPDQVTKDAICRMFQPFQ